MNHNQGQQHEAVAGLRMAGCQWRFGSTGREETRREEHHSSALGPYVGLCPSAAQAGCKQRTPAPVPTASKPGQASPVAAAVTSQGCLLFRRPPTKPQPRSQSAAGNASANALPPKAPRTRLQPRQTTLHRLSSRVVGLLEPPLDGRVCPGGPPKVPAPKLQPSTTCGSTARLAGQPQAPLGLAVRGERREATQRAPAPQTSVHQPHPHGPLGGRFDLTSCLFLLPSPFLITQYPPPHGLPDRRGGRLHATASRRPRAFLQPGCLPCT